MSNINIIWLILNNIVPHVLWPLWDQLHHCIKFGVNRSLTVLQMRLSIRNNMQPTRGLYDIRLKSYGSIREFHVFSDLDLDLWHIPVLPIFLYKSNKIPGYLQIKCCSNRISFNKLMVWHRAANTHIHIYIQTDRQTYTQTPALQ